MANKMLIDATHPEETRVVVVRGNRVEEFDFESANRKQLRGNIYLAKVTRVEPSLQAAFVDYGGNRHGFLAFSEIHPDYYQIPVADRQALIDEEERAHRDAEAEADRRAGGGGGGGGRHHRQQRRPAGRHRDDARHSETIEHAPVEGEAAHTTGVEAGGMEAGGMDGGGDIATDTHVEPMPVLDQPTSEAGHPAGGEPAREQGHEPAYEPAHASAETSGHQPDVTSAGPQDPPPAAPETATASDTGGGHDDGHDHHDHDHHDDHDHQAQAREDNGEGDGHDEPSGNGDGEEEEIVESVGGADVMEEVPDRMPRLRRQYKIQEVIKRRQIMLVQVVKEERGTKGAALTTYLSLAGRYSVLMPNTARGGGISRKITNFQDRKRLKDVAQELEVPEGMGVILRTAGATRTKPEIKRDFEYLLRMWETVRDVTLNSTAPTLVYEEGSLVKRSIRDLYNKDIDEVIVAGDTYKEARDFMRMLMPSHAKNVKPYRESQPILTRYGIESQLDAMFSPVVQLRSGGYIVINQAEALVAIDVNSGRATREHHIEDTALKTNMEAADEVARQLRLRDLAGLIVIDFIDMDEKRNNRSVERRLKECLKHDRARIQVGRISHFGLLEMSRQRIRTSVLESSTEKCPHCGGTGHVRSVASVALQVLRTIEETLLRAGTHNLLVRTRSDIAIYVLNHKRAHLRELEERFRLTITITADATMGGQTPFLVERGELVHSVEQARAIAAAQPVLAPLIEPEEDEDLFAEDEESEEIEAEAGAEESSEGEDVAEAGPIEGEDREIRENGEGGEAGDPTRRRRRRRRRGRHGEGREGAPFPSGIAPEHAAPEQAGAVPYDLEGGGEGDTGEPEDAQAGSAEPREHPPHRDGNGDGEPRRRRRGRRGGRRNRRDREGEERPAFDAVQGAIDPELADAVADFGGPPIAHENIQPDAPRTPEPSPPPHEPELARAEEPASEPPRRRSTVREPAPLVSEDSPLSYAAPSMPQPVAPPAPAPVPETQAQPQDDDGKPRRTGWWAKRLMGG
jgi:ribonuclease E